MMTLLKMLQQRMNPPTLFVPDDTKVQIKLKPLEKYMLRQMYFMLLHLSMGEPESVPNSIYE